MRSQPGQPLANRGSDGTTHATINFVKDHRARSRLFSERDFQREDEAGQFATRGDLYQRRKGRAGIGRDEEFDAVDARCIPLGLGQCFNERLEARRIQLERRKFCRDRHVKTRGSPWRRALTACAAAEISRPASSRARSSLTSPSPPALDGVKAGRLQLLGQRGKIIWLNAVLAGKAAQIEQARLICIECSWIKSKRAGGIVQPVSATPPSMIARSIASKRFSAPTYL